jgi:TIR domain
MSDVFISYSSKNRSGAQRLAAALSAQGWTVWWDREIQTGQVYHEAIEQALHAAKAVVVLWSAESVNSEWVKNEAAVAAERGVMLPANLDGTRLPLEFRARQTADLQGWDGDASHEGFVALCRGLSRLLQGRDEPEIQPVRVPDRPTPVPAARKPWPRAAVAVASLAVVAVVAVATVGLGPRVQPDVASQSPQSSQSSEASNFEAIIATVQAESARQIEKSRQLALLNQTALANAVVGTYLGDVIADSKGSSRRQVVLSVTPLADGKVRIASSYERIGSVDVELEQVGDTITNVGTEHVLRVDLSAKPRAIEWNPHHELAYAGTLQP